MVPRTRRSRTAVIFIGVPSMSAHGLAYERTPVV